jgi:hypothetical protein
MACIIFIIIEFLIQIYCEGEWRKKNKREKVYPALNLLTFAIVTVSDIKEMTNKNLFKVVLCLAKYFQLSFNSNLVVFRTLPGCEFSGG